MKNPTRINKLLTLLLVLTLCLFALPALADIQVTTHTAQPAGDLTDNDELFAGYAEKLLFADWYGGVSAFATGERSAGNGLTGTAKQIYEKLSAQVKTIAANGTADGKDTIFSFGEAINTEDGEKVPDYEYPISEPVPSENEFSFVDLALKALITDLPYEMYWFDKGGEGYEYSIYSAGEKIYLVEIYLSVAGAYQKDGKQYEVKDSASLVNTAVANAQAVVSANEGKSDREKLTAYKDYICDAVSYNNDAVTNNAAYGDPWQLIYVFDGDSKTNVVCEGYSKAFQYLCDLSDFTDAVVYTVSGNMAGGTGEGGHMWNIASIGGKNYMVDVTNSESNTVGKNGELFLAMAASGSVAEGYKMAGANGTTVTYTYDANEVALWGEEALTLALDCEHTFSDGVCTVCGAVKTYTITLSAYGAKIVEINGEAKEILHGETFTAPHGQKLTVKFENTLSKWETGVQVGAGTDDDSDLIPSYEDTNNILTIPASVVNQDLYVYASAYLRVQFNLHGGELTTKGNVQFNNDLCTWNEETTTLKAYYNRILSLSNSLQLDGHTFAGAQVNGSDEVVKSLSIRSDMTVDILWECNDTNTLTHVPATAATCTTEGNIAHYVCTCSKLYEDEAGTKELTADEVKIPVDPDNHDFDPATGVCTACGAVKTYTVTFNPYGDSGAKIVEINGEPVEIFHGETFTVPHGQELKVKFKNTLSTQEKGVYCDGYVIIDQTPIMCDYDEATNTLTIPGNKVTGDIVIGVDAYVRVQFNLHGGVMTDDYREDFEKEFGYTWDADTSTLKAKYGYSTGDFLSEFFQLAGHSFIGAKVDGSVVYSLDITGDMTVDILWSCNDLFSVPEKKATCVAEGNIAHYACACGKLYADSDGAAVWTKADVTLPVDPTAHGDGFNPATGKCKHCGKDMAAASVTTGGATTYYQTLDSALSAANGKTAAVTLLADVDMRLQEHLSSPSDITLDLNGKTITAYDTLYVDNGAALTVSGSGTIVCTSTENVSLFTVEGELNISSGGTFISDVVLVDVTNQGVLTITGAPTFDIRGNAYEFNLRIYGKLDVQNADNPAGWRVLCDTPATGSVNVGESLILPASGYALKAGDQIVTSLYDTQLGTIVEHRTHTYVNGECECGEICEHDTIGSDGKCTVCEMQFAASVTTGGATTYYWTLDSALNAANGKTAAVKLLAECVLAESHSLYSGSNITLNLNGQSVSDGNMAYIGISADQTLTIMGSGTINSSSTCFSVEGGRLEIKGGSFDTQNEAPVHIAGGEVIVTGTPAFSSSAAAFDFTVTNSGPTGKLNLQGVTSSMNGWRVANMIDGTMVVRDHIILPDGYAVQVNGEIVSTLPGQGTTGVIVDHEHTYTNGLCACGVMCEHKDFDKNTYKCNVCGEQFVAMINIDDNPFYFTSLSDAMTVANYTYKVSTITVLADCDLFYMPTLSDGSNITLNLNGKTVTAMATVDVGSGAKLTITGSGEYIAQTDYGFSINGGGMLDVSNTDPDGWRVKADGTIIALGYNLFLPDSGYALKAGDQFVTSLTDTQTGTIVAHNHDYTTEDYDATHHWTACACGATTEKVNHTFTYTPVTGKEVHIVGCSGCTYTAPEEIPHEFTNGVCVCTAKAVAKVDDTLYANFANALTGWTDGTTLTLLADVTYDNCIEIYGGSYTFVGGNYTLDLGIDTIIIYGALTIESGTIKTTEWGPIEVRSDASATINSDNTTLIGSDRQIAVDGSERLTITGKGCDGWRIFANPFNGNVPITIPDGFHLENDDGDQLDANDTLPAGDYTVIKANHTHSWSYTADDEKDTITATCVGPIGTCPSAEQSITLNAPDAVYSGNPVEAEVTSDGADLTYTLRYTGTDYDSPDAPVNAGDYTVTMTVGDKSVSVAYTVLPKPFDDTTEATLNPIEFTYDGSEKKPAVTVNAKFTSPDSEQTNSSSFRILLTEGKDYTLTYSGNTCVGTGSVTITGMGNYSGSMEKTFIITKAAADQWSIGATSPQNVVMGSGLDAVVFPENGTGIVGEAVPVTSVTFYTDATLQTPATDETVSRHGEGNSIILYYKATADNYEDTTGSVTLVIVAHQHEWSFTADEETDTITATCVGPIGTCPEGTVTFRLVIPTGIDFNSDASEKVATCEVEPASAEGLIGGGVVYTALSDNASLKDGTPYNAGDYEAMLSVGDAAVVTGTLTIAPVQLGEPALLTLEGMYTGEAHAPEVSVPLCVRDVDYTVTYSEDMVNIGAKTITVTGIGNYTGSYTLDYEITRAPLDAAVITAEDQVYTGEALMPDFTVELDGKELNHNVDFTFNWTNNVNVGEGKIMISGIANYQGEAEGTFAITSAPADLTAETYLGETMTGSFTYGEVITIKGAVTVDQQNTFSLRRAPAANEVALYLEGGNEVIAGPVAADPATGEFTLTYDTSNKDIQIGQRNLALKYVSDGNKQDTTGSLTVTLEPKELTIISAAAAGREYEKGNKLVAVTGVELDGIVAIVDDVMVDLTGVQGTLSSDNAGTYTSVALSDLSLTGSHMSFYHIADATVPTSVEITPKEIASPAIVLDATTFVYDGTEKEPAVTSVMDGEDLIDASEYTVSYTNNTEAGTATVTLTDVPGGNYTVSGSTTFQITQSGTGLTATADKASYTYGEIITVTGTATATGTAPAAFLRLFRAPAAQQVALFTADGVQLSDPADVVDGAYTLTYNTADKGILPAESITLTVKYVGDDNMADQSAAVTVTLAARSVEPALSGNTVKAFDGSTLVPDTTGIQITLDAIVAGDDVFAAAEDYVYADANAGQNKAVTASGIALIGTDNVFYTLTSTEASGPIGEITKAILTSVTTPDDQTLTVYCADADAVIAKLPSQVSCGMDDGSAVMLHVTWSCENYNATPSAENTFTWTVNDPDMLANYAFADGVADTGAIVVTNSSALPVTVTGTDTTITYNAAAYGVNQMFALDAHAGAAAFEIVSGGTGEGTLSGSALTITRAGTFTIKVTTAPNGAYAASEATATLTVNKGDPAVNVPAELQARYGQKLSDIALPAASDGVWSWANADSPVGDAGTQTHQAIFTPDNTDLWNVTTHDVTVTVAQAGTSFGEINVYNGTTETTAFTYGETITVKARTAAVAPRIRTFSLRSLVAPQRNQMALFIRNADGTERQISEAASEQSGEYTMTYDTTGKALAIGDNDLIARFVGSENMADYQQDVKVTLARKRLTIDSMSAQDRAYEAGNQKVSITDAAVSGKADANDDVAVNTEAMEATVSSADVGAYDEAQLPADVPLSGADADYYCAEGLMTVSIPDGVEITQATPHTTTGLPVQPVFDPVYQDGQTLADIPVTLPEDAFNVPGTITWEAPADTPVTEGTPYTWVFTPSDSNWAPVTGTVVLYPDGEPPVISAPDGDQEVTVYEGGQGTMTITATDATGYQWYINRNDGLGYVPLDGATSSSYTTSDANLGNNGFTYICVASNAYGETESPVFLLQVLKMVEIPDTGDHSNIALWIALTLLSIAGLTVITMADRRRRTTR